MGELIKNIAEIKNQFDIELNKATYSGGPRYVHIQNSKMRFCITESEYIQLCTVVLKSIKRLKHNKKID